MLKPIHESDPVSQAARGEWSPQGLIGNEQVR